MKKPTIYEALKAKLNREPTHAELCAEVKRILSEASGTVKVHKARWYNK